MIPGIDLSTQLTFFRNVGKGAYGSCKELATENENHDEIVIILKEISPKHTYFSQYNLEQMSKEAEFSRRLTTRYVRHMQTEHNGKSCNDGTHFCQKFYSDLSEKILAFDDGSYVFPNYRKKCFAFKSFNGFTLREVMHDQLYQFSLEQLKIITFQILQTLSILEEERILHLDLKPSNIMVKHLDDIKKLKIQLIDFGISEESFHNPITLKQSSWYRHPLADFCGKLTPSADAWSLGCILFELITEKPLFQYYDDFIQRTSFLAIVEAINGEYPQEWLREANIFQPLWIVKNQDGQLYFQPYLDPSVTSQWTMFGKTAKDFYILDPIYQAAVLKGHDQDEIKILADLTASLVSYTPPTIQEASTIINSILKPSSPTDVTELLEAFGDLQEDLFDPLV